MTRPVSDTATALDATAAQVVSPVTAPGNTENPTAGGSIAPFGWGVTITVHREQRDTFGNRSEVSQHSIVGCSVEVRHSKEEIGADRRDTVVTGLRIYAPVDADVRATDVITLPAPVTGRFEVEGDVHRQISPFTGWSPGCVIYLTRVTG